MEKEVSRYSQNRLSLSPQTFAQPICDGHQSSQGIQLRAAASACVCVCAQKLFQAAYDAGSDLRARSGSSPAGQTQAEGKSVEQIVATRMIMFAFRCICFPGDSRCN